VTNYPTDDAVTLTGATKLKTGTVAKNGMIHVGRDYAGQTVKVAVKPIDDDQTGTNEEQEVAEADD